MTDNAKTDDDELRSEIGFLGKLLGDTIRELAGDEAFETVEELRRLAWNRRIGSEESEPRMLARIASLDNHQVRIVTRAFSVFLDLLNVVEDRRRVHVLAERASKSYPAPHGESIREAIATLKGLGKSADEVQALVDRLAIELVFTAHPTDAKRRSVRNKLTSIRVLMSELDRDPLPQQRDRIETSLRGELAKLWQTSFIRPWRPTVMQEVSRGLSIKPVLWNEVPRVDEELRQALAENFGDDVQIRHPVVTYGSWIGGDRDGHPGVTAPITQETVSWLRSEAIKFQLSACDSLFHSLSLSTRQSDIHASLENAAAANRIVLPKPVRTFFSVAARRSLPSLAFHDSVATGTNQIADVGFKGQRFRRRDRRRLPKCERTCRRRRDAGFRSRRNRGRKVHLAGTKTLAVTDRYVWFSPRAVGRSPKRQGLPRSHARGNGADRRRRRLRGHVRSRADRVLRIDAGQTDNALGRRTFAFGSRNTRHVPSPAPDHRKIFALRVGRSCDQHDIFGQRCADGALALESNVSHVVRCSRWIGNQQPRAADRTAAGNDRRPTARASDLGQHVRNPSVPRIRSQPGRPTNGHARLFR